MGFVVVILVEFVIITVGVVGFKSTSVLSPFVSVISELSEVIHVSVVLKKVSNSKVAETLEFLD